MRAKNKKVIFIGGFGYGQDIVDETCRNLSNKFGHVKGYTFNDAIHNRRVIVRQVNGADVIVHSAGIMVLKNTSPNLVIVYGGPLGDSNNFIIFFKTIYKSVQMVFVHNLTKALDLHKSSAKALFSRIRSDSDEGILKYYFDKSISNCDSVVIAQGLIENGCKKVQLIYGEKDVYFKPAQKDIDRISKIKKIKLKFVPNAVHDEIILNDDLSDLWD